ncbi:hypothetical protein [Salibacterium aidingense]|uniref:hypothetical protein n=1 Tax=Salibacterium aidingense TaxID=384933 RepID=UPI00041F32C9|nr:hypothetical protein [Salibacterium aidingense]
MNDMAKDVIVREVVGEIYDAFPDLWDQFEERGHEKTKEDNVQHLDHLETTYEMDNIDFFMNYTEWLDNIRTSRNLDRYLIIDNFERLQRIIPGNVEPEEESAYVFYLETAIEVLKARQEGQE